MSIAIDTNAYSALMSGDETVKRILEDAASVVVPVIVAGELLAGFSRGSRYARNLADFEAFLRLPGICVKGVDLEAAHRYASLMKAIFRAGTPLPMNDVWIAAIALGSGGRVLTRDAHFDLIPGIVMISW